MTATGPSFRLPPIKHAPPVRELNPALKARILTALQRGPATGDAIARTLHHPQQEVNGKLSRLFRDGHIERALDATSPHTGRRVLLYWLRKE